VIQSLVSHTCVYHRHTYALYFQSRLDWNQTPVVNDYISAPVLSWWNDTKNLCRKWWVCPFLLHGCGTKQSVPVTCI